MATDITTAGMALATRLENSEECAHITFPEVGQVEWLPSLLVSMIEQLGEMVAKGEPLDILASAAEHAFIIAAAAGITAGRALATEELLDGLDAFEADGGFSLDSVDWDNLPDVTEGD